MALSGEEVRSRLRDWIEANVEGWRNVRLQPLEVSVGSGFSADIFFVDVAYDDAAGAQARTLVVRRQPAELVVVHASSLEMQGRMMAALDRLKVAPVPEWIGMELDPAVLGQPFLIMGRVAGQSATQNPNYNTTGWVADMTPAQRGATWKNAIEAFAQLHRIDWQADGFAFLGNAEWGRPGLDQYLGHIESWYHSCRKGRTMPYVDAAVAYIRANEPADTATNVLWGDSTPSNVMFLPDGTVSGLIDWELAALGPSELDLAWWLYFDDLFSRRFGVAKLEGLPSREETIAIWEAAVGRAAQHLDYYGVVVALRMALVAVGAFDRQVGIGNISPENQSLNANFMTLTLADKLGMEPPELGPDFYAFMRKLTPVEREGD